MQVDNKADRFFCFPMISMVCTGSVPRKLELSNQLLSFFVIGYFFLMCTTRRFSIFSIDCVICSKNTKRCNSLYDELHLFLSLSIIYPLPTFIQVAFFHSHSNGPWRCERSHQLQKKYCKKNTLTPIRIHAVMPVCR